MYYTSTIQVLYMHYTGTIQVLYMYYTCTIHVLYMYYHTHCCLGITCAAYLKRSVRTEGDNMIVSNENVIIRGDCETRDISEYVEPSSFRTLYTFFFSLSHESHESQEW